MNKLDALIAGMKQAEHGDVTALREACPPVQLRRILEAVREDMGKADAACETDRLCVLDRGGCSECPRQYHAATRAALEQLK